MALNVDWYGILMFLVTPYSKNVAIQCCIMGVASNLLSSSIVGNMNMSKMGVITQ